MKTKEQILIDREVANESCDWWKSQYNEVMSECQEIENEIDNFGWSSERKEKLDECEKKIDLLINKGKYEIKNLNNIRQEEARFTWDTLPKKSTNTKINWQYTEWDKNGNKTKDENKDKISQTTRKKMSNQAFTMNSKTLLSVDFARFKTCPQICDYCYVGNLERIYPAYASKLKTNDKWSKDNPTTFGLQLNAEYEKKRKSKAKNYKRLDKLPVRIYGSGDFIPEHLKDEVNKDNTKMMLEIIEYQISS